MILQAGYHFACIFTNKRYAMFTASGGYAFIWFNALYGNAVFLLCYGNLP
jgi:hypothetical protein